MFEYKEFNYKKTDALKEEINNFILSCMRKEIPKVDGIQGRDAVKKVLLENPDLLDELEEKIMDTLKALN